MGNRRRAGLVLLSLNLLVAPALTLSATGGEFEIRLGSGETNVDRYQDYHYNAIVLGDVTQLANFESSYPGAIPKGSALRNRIDHQRKKFEKEYDQATKLGLAVCLMTDEVTLPTPIAQRIENSAATTDTTPHIDMDRPEFWDAFRAKYREVLRAYPGVAYVMVRTGENYSHADEGFTGHTVLEGKYDDAYFRHMQRLIEETRKIVVDEFGRKLIWRTWDLGNDGFHANPQVYDRVLAGLPDRKGLILAIKFTQTDFWRYNDFNPMIGRGGVDQIIEFQCAREYEGKGAYPDYMGVDHAEAMQKLASIGVKGVWIWDFSGGWGGPFLKSDRWDRLNIEATTRLAENPNLSPRQIARDWAAKEFGDRAANKVADLLMLSSECVRKFIYVEAYARDHRGWKPGLNLMRDDIIRGEVLKQLYDGSKDALPQVIDEKEQAVALATQMRELFESEHADIAADRGEQVYQESLSSLIYEQSLATVVCHYVNGMFLYYQWQETHNPTVAARARQELQAWSVAWKDYQTNVPKLPGVATLYRSQNTQEAASAKGAMADLCQSAMRKLAVASTSPSASVLQTKN
jgi:hypothetical protein